MTDRTDKREKNIHQDTEQYTDSTGYTQSEPNTRILSDDERRDFDGVTIDEAGDSVHVESTPTATDQERAYYEGYEQYGPRVKVYHFGGSNWLSRIIMLIILAAGLAAIVIFGSLIFTVVGAIILIGAIISFIFGLF
ncbi:DUF4229 domain-containing protein [Veillonella rodentium]|uniref:Uncharacterized protein n=1 Tax=Veillonella rodentium TaxID=248315 RepID=A0A239Z5A3_9FIRM|nr:DUF4229 domain-containing protein [Veillonella rodentium]SNV65806.1 Uncharacterised protein [Veillonella rodentium]